MKPSRVLTILAIVSLTSAAEAQYVVQVPYFTNDPYSGNPAVGQTYFSIQRPDEAYRSVRLRGLSSAFSGLVRDAYSDYFRNPANRASEVPVELFGDLGSVASNGNFLLGGVINSGSSSWGGFVTLDGLMKNTSRSDYTSLNPNSPARNTSFLEYSPEKIGGRLSYSSTASSDVTFGASYEFSSATQDERFEFVHDYSSSSYPDTRKNVRDDSRNSKIHRISGGTLVQLESATLELGVTGLFTRNSLTEYFDYFFHTSSNLSGNQFSFPTEITTKGLLVEAVYKFPPQEKAQSQILARFAYTKFDATGSSLSLYFSRYSPPYSPYYNKQSSSRNASGSIIDAKVGFGFERKLSESFSGYAAFSVSYVRNKATGSEDGTKVDSSGSVGTSSSFSNSLSDTKTQVDVRIPLAIEYFIGEHITFRGGLEPRYRSGETSVGEQSIYDPPHTSTIARRIQERGLALNSSFGMSAQHKDYGAIDLLFGNALSETRYWSIAIRYFL